MHKHISADESQLINFTKKKQLHVDVIATVKRSTVETHRLDYKIAFTGIQCFNAKQQLLR